MPGLRRSRSTPGAQPGIGLEVIDQGHELARANDSLELETGTVSVRPDKVSLDPAYARQADHHPFAPAKLKLALSHEAVRRKVHDVKLDVPTLAMFADHPVINRMTGRPPHVGH